MSKGLVFLPFFSTRYARVKTLPELKAPHYFILRCCKNRFPQHYSLDGCMPIAVSYPFVAAPQSVWWPSRCPPDIQIQLSDVQQHSDRCCGRTSPKPVDSLQYDSLYTVHDLFGGFIRTYVKRTGLLTCRSFLVGYSALYLSLIITFLAHYLYIVKNYYYYEINPALWNLTDHETMSWLHLSFKKLHLIIKFEKLHLSIFI